MSEPKRMTGNPPNPYARGTKYHFLYDVFTRKRVPSTKQIHAAYERRGWITTDNAIYLFKSHAANGRLAKLPGKRIKMGKQDHGSTVRAQC